MGYFVYIIASVKNFKLKTYVGWTTNLNNRLKKHNLGIGAKSTRGRKWKIIYHEILNSKKKGYEKRILFKKK